MKTGRILPLRRPARRSGGYPKIDPNTVDPNKLVAAMTGMGWKRGGHRTGIYVRLVMPGEDTVRGRSTIIPLDRQAPEYQSLMVDAVRQLVDVAQLGDRAEGVLRTVSGQGTDEVVDEDVIALDAAMAHIFLTCWQEATRRMTSDQREAAAAAVLRYYERHADDLPTLDRSRVAWWE